MRKPIDLRSVYFLGCRLADFYYNKSIAGNRSRLSRKPTKLERERVDPDGQTSDAHAGEHGGIFGHERGEIRMRRLELFNGLF